MPQPLIERFNVPSLTNYSLFSFTLLGFIVLFACNHVDEFITDVQNHNITDIKEQKQSFLYGLTFSEYCYCLWLAACSQFWCVLGMINICYCVLAIIGKCIQCIVFGELRVREVQQLKEKFWNFAFYKFIFIFGVMNVQVLDYALMWTAWFSFVCALQLLAQLSKYRFEYLSCSPATPKAQHVKLLFLLTLILLTSFCLVGASIFAALYSDWNIFAFLVAECLLLIIKTSHVILKYVIYLIDISHEGLWEFRGTLSYYADYSTEMLCLLIELIHYVHMVVWSNIILSMASLVLCMQVKYIFNEMQKRYLKHRTYLDICKSMEVRFAEATPEEIINYDDNCAICWDKMLKARKLPCGHLFHNSCLRSWMAQDVSCPTCRVNLSEDKANEEDSRQNFEMSASVSPTNEPIVAPHRPILVPSSNRPQITRRLNQTNRSFHFDASRYVSWLPRVSVEVTHRQISFPEQLQLPASPIGSMDSMARDIQSLFPSMSLNSIIEDLRATHSVEITVENILEGRLTINPSLEEETPYESRNSEGDTLLLEAMDLNTHEPQPSTSQSVRFVTQQDSEPIDDSP